MTKTTRALSGASKDAYFRDVIAGEGEVPDAARERLIGRFQSGVSQVRIRLADAPLRSLSQSSARLGDDQDDMEEADEPQASFDPFTPNVLVVVRREGADAAFAQLKSIGNANNLKLISREQQLSIGDDVAGVEEIARAIVEAATRRIANMRAAAR